MALSHDSRAPLTTKSHLELGVSSFSAWRTGRRPHSRSLGLATCSPHSRPAYPYQARSPRPHCAHSCSTEAVWWCEQQLLSPCLPGLWPHACRPRHCVQARDPLWYGRQDHDRHTAATRCANPARDHPRLCARRDRCRQPTSATIPISQDTRLRSRFCAWV